MKKNLKIRSTNFKVALGDVNKNKETIKEIIKKADQDKVDILSLPELSLTGASLYDGYLDLVDSCEKALIELLKFSKDYKIIFTLGFPFSYNNKLYNAIALILAGELLYIYTKKNLSVLEKNIFANDLEDDVIINILDSWPDFNPSWATINQLPIGITIGEDELLPIPRSLSYKEKAECSRQIILHPSADPKFALKDEKISKAVEFLSKDLTYIHTSQGLGESSTDFVYSGLNIIAKDGEIIKSSNNKEIDYVGRFSLEIDEESLFYKKFDNPIEKKEKFPYLPVYEKRDQYINDVLEIGASGLLNRMNHIGIKDVFIGISGGLDSTMALLTIVHAFKKENMDFKAIHCYTMPAFGTSHRTKSNAYRLCESLGLTLKEIDISEAVKIHLRDIGHDGVTADSAYENAQARERTQVLFDLANMGNGIVIGTGDLSENMQGFATYNGDHMSNYSLNASLMKTEIRYIIEAIANDTENIKLKEVLMDIIDTPVSPELINESKDQISQKTEDIIGPYELIDFFIYEHLTYHLSAKEILEDTYSAFSDKYDLDTIKKWLISYFKRFTTSQFKRSATVDGANITGRSFSPRAGFKIPSDMTYRSYIEDLDE